MEHVDRAVSILALAAAAVSVVGFVVMAIAVGVIACKRKFNPVR